MTIHQQHVTATVMTAALLALLSAEPTFAGTPVAVHSTDFGNIRAEVRGNDLILVVPDGLSTLFCRANKNAEWTKVGAFATQVASYNGTAAEVDFGNAKDSAIDRITQYPGWCNVSATRRSDRVTLVFESVRACFGSAGCNRDYAATTLTISQTAGIGKYLEDFAATAGKTEFEVKSHKANVVTLWAVVGIVSFSAGLAYWSTKDLF